MKKTNKKALAVIIILFIVYAIYMFSKLLLTIASDQESWSKTSLPAYNGLFDGQVKNRLQILSTIKSKNRQPESSYIYDGKFNVFVTRVVLSHNTFLENIINIKKEVSSINNGEVYSPLPGNDFEIHKKEGSTDSVSKINIKYSGSFIKTVMKNDSVACYFLNFQTFSWSYNDNFNAYDVIAYTNKPINYPMQIAFIQHGNYMYIIMMTVAQGKEIMQPNLLYTLLSE